MLASQGIQSVLTGIEAGVNKAFFTEATGKNDQGASDPQQLSFPNHAVVQLAGKDAVAQINRTDTDQHYTIYDPSYGTAFSGSTLEKAEEAWETGSIMLCLKAPFLPAP